MLRLRHTAHLNALPYHTFHQQPLTHKERDRYPTHQTHRCRCATAPIGYNTVGVGAKACNAPCWQADCSVSAVLVVVCGLCATAVATLWQRHRRGTCQSLLCLRTTIATHKQARKKTLTGLPLASKSTFVLQSWRFCLSEGSEKKERGRFGGGCGDLTFVHSPSICCLATTQSVPCG